MKLKFTKKLSLFFNVIVKKGNMLVNKIINIFFKIIGMVISGIDIESKFKYLEISLFESFFSKYIEIKFKITDVITTIKTFIFNNKILTNAVNKKIVKRQ